MVPLEELAPLTVVAFPGHIVAVPPANAIGASLIVIIIVSETALQGPVGSFVVKVKVVFPPARNSAAEGVYIAFKVVLSGLNVPVPPVQVAEVALPPIEPARVTFGVVEHIV